MNILRGSGPNGLSGIPPVRGNIIRPLINLYRQDILDFAAARGLKSVEDQTNTDARFLRNRVRHTLLPMLSEKNNPEISRNLNHMAQIFRKEEEWHRELIGQLFDQACLATTGTEIALSASFLAALPIAAQRRLIRKAIKTVKNDLRRVTFEHIESIRKCLKNNNYFSLDLPDATIVIREHNALRFLSGSADNNAATDKNNMFCYTLFEQGARDETLEIEAIGARIDFCVLGKSDLTDTNPDIS